MTPAPDDREPVTTTRLLWAWVGEHDETAIVYRSIVTRPIHPEPPPDDYPLYGLPNVKLLPHLASRTEPATLNMSWVVRDIVRVLNGEEPQYSAT